MGTYTVQVSTVALDGVIFIPTGTTSFVMTVQDLPELAALERVGQEPYFSPALKNITMQQCPD